jgi:biotin carboxyl carrier protein
MRLRRGDGGEFEIDVAVRDLSILAKIDGREVAATIERSPGAATITLNGRRHRVLIAKARDRIFIACGPASFEFVPIEETRARGARGLAAPEIVAPMPGKVLRIAVNEGDRVDVGDAIVVLEAMKMETTLSAESPAVIKKIRVSAGQMVDHGAVLVELAPITPDSLPR